jgi:arabinofuranosyltransferase
LTRSPADAGEVSEWGRREDTNLRGGRAWSWLIVAALLAAFSVVFYRNAWLGDDDFITFRSVEQLFAGHGPRWNPHERVQAFTHPLWFLLLACARTFTRDVFVSSLGLAFLCTLAALLVARRILAGDLARWALALGILVSSKAFVDYCATGLENALSFLLLAVFVDLYLRLPRAEARSKRHDTPILALTATAALVALCRHDLLLICAPALLAALWERRQAGSRQLAVALVLGSLPLLAWTAFALCYYGFPFPNTAYAKLHTGIPESELWRQGLHYLGNAMRWDTLTPAVCFAGIAFAPLRRRWTPIACGLAAYLVYVVLIGGDFMAGRFLSQVFWLACLALCSCLPRGGERPAVGVGAGVGARVGIGVAALLLIVYNVAIPGLPATVRPGYTTPYRFRSPQEHGIADEKGQYFGQLSLAAHLAGIPPGPPPAPEPVTVEGAIGVQGYLAGTEKILIDPNGLADPLLSRLPAARPWRIGHFRRDLPAGYVESVAGAANRIADPEIRHLYERLSLVTRGPLWRRERWQAIAELNRP